MTRQEWALLCDLDGTLVDSVPALFRVYDAFLDKRDARGPRIPPEVYNGVPIGDMIRDLVSRGAIDGRVEELCVEYEALIDEVYLGLEPSEGARDLLQWTRQANWQCAVVTSGRRMRATRWLGSNELMELVDVVVGGDDVEAGKPAPDPYLRAAALLRHDPARCWGVEDSMSGLRSAIAAGVGHVAYLGADAPNADHAIERFACLDDVRLRLGEFSSGVAG